MAGVAGRPRDHQFVKHEDRLTAGVESAWGNGLGANSALHWPTQPEGSAEGPGRILDAQVDVGVQWDL